MVGDCLGSLLAVTLCCTATSNAQVGGPGIHNALEGDEDAVQETFEGVDLIGIHVLVGIVDRTTYHNKEQELQQQRQEASLSWYSG